VTPLLLVAVAHAHPSPVPHIHPSDPAAFWIVAAWAVAAVVWAGLALRARGKVASA
jgi:hypothetical protein